MPRQGQAQETERELEEPEEEQHREDQQREEQPRGGGGRGINQITLVGRLTRDPDMRVTEAGVPRAWFVLAVPRPFAAKDGERDADFISIVSWRQLATVVGEHLTKGRLVGVTGRLQVSTLDDGSGNRRFSAEVVADQIVFLDAPRKAATAES
ncbi:MAG: single-stranded DNA-binding protein [bacterium]